MSLRLIKKAIMKNNFIILVSWCLCGKVPELQKKE